MAFRHFDIRHISNHTCVDENEIDKLICNKFNFTSSEEDYGHFFFTENEAEEFHQKSISWVGLLDWIIYYSFIGYGKRSKYEIEAALAWTRQYVGMPYSTVQFLSDLLDFLKEKGYYVFVYGLSADKEDDYFQNSYRGNRIFENESGLFLCNNNGGLLAFFPAIDNLLDESVLKQSYTFQDAYYKPCVHSMIIPEGVFSIEMDFFRGGLVKEKLLLPNTLKLIDSNVFADSCLPEINIPESVNMIGTFAFGNSIIKSVRFTRIFECEYLRQFKGASIDTLYLPKNCRQEWNKKFNGYAYLHDAQDIVFY